MLTLDSTSSHKYHFVLAFCCRFALGAARTILRVGLKSSMMENGEPSALKGGE